MADTPAVAAEMAPASSDTPAAPTPADLAAADAPVTGGDVWIVGYIADTNEAVLSDSDAPEDATLVWLASTPDAKVPMADLDDTYPDGGVEWLAEPEPASAAAPDETAPEAMVASAMADENDVLADAEAKLAGLEGLVAGILLDTLEDERFVDDDPDTDSDLPGQQARVAATARAYLNATLAHTAAADPEADPDGTFAEDDTEGVTIDAEKDPDESGTTDDTDEADERLAAVTERIAKLEATIADIMESSLDDEEMIDEDDVDGDLSTVDERDDDKSKG